MVGFLSCESTLLAHVLPTIHQYPQLLFGTAVLYLYIPQLVLIMRVAITQVQDLALGFVEPHEIFFWTRCSSLPRSHWMAPHLSGVLTMPHSLVSSTNLLKVHSTPFSMSLTSLGVGPLITDLHPDIELLTTTLWTQSCSQFFIH